MPTAYAIFGRGVVPVGRSIETGPDHQQDRRPAGRVQSRLGAVGSGVVQNCGALFEFEPGPHREAIVRTA